MHIPPFLHGCGWHMLISTREALNHTLQECLSIYNSCLQTLTIMVLKISLSSIHFTISFLYPTLSISSLRASNIALSLPAMDSLSFNFSCTDQIYQFLISLIRFLCVSSLSADILLHSLSIHKILSILL